MRFIPELGRAGLVLVVLPLAFVLKGSSELSLTRANVMLARGTWWLWEEVFLVHFPAVWKNDLWHLSQHFQARFLVPLTELVSPRGFPQCGAAAKGTALNEAGPPIIMGCIPKGGCVLSLKLATMFCGFCGVTCGTVATSRIPMPRRPKVLHLNHLPVPLSVPSAAYDNRTAREVDVRGAQSLLGDHVPSGSSCVWFVRESSEIFVSLYLYTLRAGEYESGPDQAAMLAVSGSSMSTHRSGDISEGGQEEGQEGRQVIEARVQHMFESMLRDWVSWYVDYREALAASGKCASWLDVRMDHVQKSQRVPWLDATAAESLSSMGWLDALLDHLGLPESGCPASPQHASVRGELVTTLREEGVLLQATSASSSRHVSSASAAEKALVREVILADPGRRAILKDLNRRMGFVSDQQAR